MAIVLVISRPDKPEIKQEISVNGKMVIGQSVYCDVKLDDKLIANMQCQVHTAKSGHIVVTNLDLKREVYINKTRLRKSSLKVDDVLTIGPFVIIIDPDKLTLEELEVINTEYIEYC
ncbi:MAG: FHA domain-containing protein [Bacteriovorax sp.]|nr:FHA domain-containing protein [Bacteriovorax sp.]